MTATISKTDANAFIKKFSLEDLSDIEFNAYIEIANSVDASFTTAAYSDAKTQMIKLYLVALMSLNGVRMLYMKRVDVLSKTYQRENIDTVFNALRSKLVAMDTSSVVYSLIPSAGDQAFMFVTGAVYE